MLIPMKSAKRTIQQLRMKYGFACSNNAPKIIAGVTILAAIGQLAACDAFTSNTKSEAEIQVEPRVLRNTDLNTSASPGGELANSVGSAYKTNVQLPDDQQGRVAVTGSDAIPYPIYPDAKQYRVGGENGLHVVIFETNDSFEEVDNFYQRHIGSQGYARLVGMSDYVRYDTSRETAGSDTDAWQNDRPGIVIHGFTDSDEATRSGADPEARTNIIVSY